MKKLFTLAFALCLGTSAFAQNWKEGQEITDQVEWGNLSFENDPMDFWTFESTKGSITSTGGLFELYDGADADLYQYVKLPAGMYEVTCQGYYRWGTSWDEDPNQFGKDAWENNAFLYVQNGVYNIDSNEFTQDREFKTPLMPRLFEEVYEMLFEDTDYTINENGEKVFNAGWDMSDGRYDQVGGKYAPCSVPGSLVWFQAGKYQPYNDGTGTKYNTVKFFLLEDGYVRLGVKKTKEKSADSFMATNFKMFYQGEAGEAAQLVLALDEFEEVMGKALNLSDEIRNNNYGSLATFLFDEILDLDYDDSDLESVNGAIDQMNNIYDQYQAYYTKAQQLTALIKAVSDMLASTDYNGKADCQAVLDEAIAVANDGNGMGEITLVSAEDYVNAYNKLNEARSNYLMGQDPVNGARNFSALITTPFFCDVKYNPQWNEVNNRYEFPYIEGVADELQLENTWANIQEQGYSEAIAEAGREEWIPIVNEFKIFNGEEPENQWIIRSTTWHGGGPVSVTMQHSYPAIGGWTAEPTGDPEDLYQIITGLPNGFYSMGALMCNAGADISELQYAYIESGNGIETAPLTQKGDPWWGWGKDQWRATVWQKLQTAMVEVTDGTVRIGTKSDAFYASTGFQLYYYGETPPFSEMLSEKLEAAKENFASRANDGSLWPADVKTVEGMFADMPTELNDYDAYVAANSMLDDINAFVKLASGTVTSFTAVDDYINLQAQYEADADLLNPAVNYVLDLGIHETDSYTDAIAATEVEKAYAEYMMVRADAETYDSAEINELLTAQGAYLTENYASAQLLIDYMNALKTPINRSIFASLGADKASEMNPVDVSQLLVNPSFQYGPNYGWTGVLTDDGSVLYASCNEFGREQAEIWNVGPFEFSQIIRGLPAGAYELRCRALYRDAGDPGSATGGPYFNWWYVAGAEMDFWENKNAVLFLNNGEVERTDYLKSICDGLFEEPSFEGFFKITDGDYTVGNNGNFIWWEELKEEDKDGFFDPETGEIYYDDRINLDAPGYPYDAKVVDGDAVYWYPTSMAGVYKRMQMNPEAYCNSTQIMVEDGGTLRLGLRKDKAIGSDWVIFDDFQLFYLGTTAPSAIEGFETATENTNTGIYNVAGQKVDASYKGIVIMNGKKALRK